MGIAGLKEFLTKNPRYFAEELILNDIDLVIDADKLCEYLYDDQCEDITSPNYRNDVYGGDLVSYAHMVRRFLRNLKSCNIRPIFIFGGCPRANRNNQNEIKYQEGNLVARGLESFEDLRLLNEELAYHLNVIRPQGISNIFTGIIREFGHELIYAPYEPDNYLARIAIQSKSPVLTNDADMFIFSLDEGLILIDLFQWKYPYNDTNSKMFIRAVTLSQSRIERMLPGFSRENLPLLKFLLDNDYVQPGELDGLLNAIRVSHCFSFVAHSFNHSRIANVLSYTVDRSLDECIMALKENFVDPEYLESLIGRTLNKFKTESVADLISELEIVYPRGKLNREASVAQQPAVYIRRLMQEEQLSRVALDIIFRQPHYLYNVIDDPNFKTSTFPVFRAYSMALVLLRPSSYEQLTAAERQVREEKDSFIYYDRQRDSYTMFTLKPLDKLDGFGSLDHLDCYSMILLDPKVKQSLLMSCFRFTHEQVRLMMDTLRPILRGPFLEDASLTFMLVKYIGRETESGMLPSFVNAILISYIYYAGEHDYLPTDESCYEQLWPLLEPHTRRNNRVQYQKKLNYYRPINHLINQLQATIRGFEMINTLLGTVYKPLGRDKWFNGVLLFRLVRMLELGELTLDDLSKSLPDLPTITRSLGDQVQFMDEWID